MAEDEFVPGNLLFSDRYALKTTGGLTTSIIAGSATSSGYVEGVGSDARFTSIVSFVQLSATHVIEADESNHCLRSINRTTNQTETYAGSCGHSGDQDGVAALFNTPVLIIIDVSQPHQLFVSHFCSSANLKSISTDNKNVSTILHSTLCFLYLAQQQSSGNIFATFTHGLGIYDYQNNSFNVISGSSRGFVDGDLSQARFSSPRGLELLSLDILIIADWGNQRLRLIDLDNNTSSSICSGVGGIIMVICHHVS